MKNDLIRCCAQKTNDAKQKVVTVDEAANGYPAQGWEYVAKISGNKVVIELSEL